MIRRRAAGASLHANIGCHTFRATGITAYLEGGGTLENAQAMAAHGTTKLFGFPGEMTQAPPLFSLIGQLSSMH